MKIFSRFTLVATIALFSLLLSSAWAVSKGYPAARNSATARPLGLGVILGDPTGLTGKVWTGSQSAIDFGLAFSFGDYMLIYADYLYHFPGAFGQSSNFARDLTPYLGIGGLIAFSTDGRYRDDRGVVFRNTNSSVGLGLRIPLGLEWRAPDVPIGVFVELVPGISLVPNTSGFLQGGIGARFYF
jgi:hypothetical protein